MYTYVKVGMAELHAPNDEIDVYQVRARYEVGSMTFDELVTALREKDVRVFEDGSGFKLKAPKGILTAEFLELISGYKGELLYLVRMGDVRVCPARWDHRPSWRYSPVAQTFICNACRQEKAA